MTRPALWGSEGVGRATLAARLTAELGPDSGGPPPVLDATPHAERTLEQLLALGGDCDALLIVVEAGHELDLEVRRFAHLVSLLGTPEIALVVNKLDAANDAERAFATIQADWDELAAQVGLRVTACIPTSGERGDNVGVHDPRPDWYSGPTLAAYLESAALRSGRGERAREPAHEADQIQATIVWSHEDPMFRGRSYQLRIGGRTVTATVSPLKYRVNLDTLVHAAATRLERGEIGVAALELSDAIQFDPYAENPAAGNFELLDSITEEVIGVGLIQFGLRRSHNVRWQALTVDREARAKQLGQSPCVVWLTGLSGAGKSTIANLVESELYRRGRQTYLLDGDNVRHGLNRDLGFTDADRVENIRRVAEVAHLMMDAGLIVLVSFISPFRSERLMARELFAEGEFFEVYVETPLAVAEERDVKGLYAKARRGELRNFTGIDSPYEPPESPELRVDTTAGDPSAAAAAVLAMLERASVLQAR